MDEKSLLHYSRLQFRSDCAYMQKPEKTLWNFYLNLRFFACIYLQAVISNVCHTGATVCHYAETFANAEDFLH